MSAKHTPGPFVQVKRPRRWGIPTTAQFKLLAECAEDGSAFQRGHSLSTLRACQQRQWITILAAQYGDDDNLAVITDQGRACLAMNSERTPP